MLDSLEIYSNSTGLNCDKSYLLEKKLNSGGWTLNETLRVFRI